MELIILLILVFYSIVFHEIAHGFVAYKLGDPTAKYEGRLSLNPLVHIDPYGTLILPFLTFVFFNGLILGYAKPVPYNPHYLKDKNRDPILIALAGPLVNISLSFFFFFLYKLLLNQPLSEIFLSLFRINLFLALFNLLPLPPLDGSKLLLLFMSFEEYALLEAYGFVFVVLFIIFFGSYFFAFIFILVFYFDIFSKFSFKLPQSNKIISRESSKEKEEKIIQPSEEVEINKINYQNFNLILEDESLGEKNTIKASLNSILTLNLIAKDKTYEVLIDGYNLFSEIKKGETKTIQFQALREGDFKIICNNCKNKILGYIIIIK